MNEIGFWPQALEEGVLMDGGLLSQGAQLKLAIGAHRCGLGGLRGLGRRRQRTASPPGRGWAPVGRALHGRVRPAYPRGGGAWLNYSLYRILRDGHSIQAKLTSLKLIIGPGDDGEPVITILLRNED